MANRAYRYFNGGGEVYDVEGLSGYRLKNKIKGIENKFQNHRKLIHCKNDRRKTTDIYVNNYCNDFGKLSNHLVCISNQLRRAQLN